MLGADDLVSQHDPGVVSPAKFIRHYPEMMMADTETYDYRVAAAFSILETGRVMLPSGYLLEEQENKFRVMLKKLKYDPGMIERSFEVGRSETKAVVAFSKKDGYNLLSAKLRYTPLRTDSAWFPTPPSYMEAVQPHWGTIRTMFIDSSDQFIPPALVHFSTDTASEFYHLVQEVYRISKDTGANAEYHRTLAGFWDCNPFAITTSGHMMIGLKKISPGGHWMNIAALGSHAAHLNFDQTIEVETLVAATLMDGFIVCWDEKYRTNRIRPETYIDRYIDAKWQPYLQTPPFPEYTSGHSVISTAAAEVLTYLLGERLDYTDNTEELWDIKPRNFHSFRDAAAEAAISRLYGGIHYRDAVVSGQVQGKALATYIIKKLRASGVRPLR
jgi:hypothetical protein